MIKKINRNKGSPRSHNRKNDIRKKLGVKNCAHQLQTSSKKLKDCPCKSQTPYVVCRALNTRANTCKLSEWPGRVKL